MRFQFVGITKMIEENASRVKILRNAMMGYYKNIIKNEVTLSGVTNTDHILCIGGGYMPCTAVLFHKMTGAKVTIIDNDESTMESAKSLVANLRLDKYIDVKYKDGADIDASAYDMIHIAMQVSPKTKVCEHIFGSMKVGAKLLIRKPKKHLENGYHCNQCKLQAVAQIKQCLFSNIERTLMYVK